MHQSLTFKQICFAPFKFPFCFLALGNVSINEVDGSLLSAKRNAPSDDRSVKANTVFALPNGLLLNSVSRTQPIPVLESLSAQLLGDDQVGKPLSRNLFCCVPEHSCEFLVDPQHVKVIIGQDYRVGR